MRKKIAVNASALLISLAFVFPVSANEIPDERLLPRFYDEADLLTDSEEEDLTKKLDEISERQDVDVVIATVNSLDGKDVVAYADDYFDYNGFGMGEDADGVLLLVSMEDRDWAISTCGFGITAFTDKGQEYISDHFLSDLSDGYYEDAFNTFADLSDDFITQAKTGKPYDVNNMPKKKLSPFWILGSMLIGFGIALVMGLVEKSKLKSVHKQVSAKAYEKEGSMHLTTNRDVLINVVTTSRVIESEKSSGGGSSTHSSSSGRSHGGSHGKF